MGVFGDLDRNKIPTNPYWVEEGEYTATISNAFTHKQPKKGSDDPNDVQDQFVIVYTISDTNSVYFESDVRDYFHFFPDLTDEDYEALDPREKKRVKAALSAIRRRLCGQEEDDDDIGLGVDPKDLQEMDPKDLAISLIGTEVDLGVVNRGTKNQYSNVYWARKRNV